MSCLIRVSHRVVCTSDNISETSDLTIYENGIQERTCCCNTSNVPSGDVSEFYWISMESSNSCL